MFVIAFEGIDKAGKETASHAFAAFLRSRGYHVLEDSFPHYETAIGQKIRKALHGEIEVTDMELTELYELDRYLAQGDWYLADAQEKIDFLVLDRHIMSNMVFGRAKGIDSKEILKLQDSIIKPDLHIIVDISVEESLRRGQNYEVLDLNEQNVELLQKVRDLQLEYVEAGSYYGHGEVLKVNGEQSREDVQKEIINTVMHRSEAPIFFK